MQRILNNTRYFILLPIIGLVLLVALSVEALGGAAHSPEAHSAVIIEVVEYVHIFLVGTVLFITAIGLYQLFIHQIQFNSWLQIDNVEELETNLIGVLVGRPAYWELSASCLVCCFWVTLPVSPWPCPGPLAF